MECAYCKSQFTPKIKTMVYCSKTCKAKNDVKKRSNKPLSKQCQCCTKEFTPYTSLDKFCSANCRVENQKSKRSRRWNAESTSKILGANNPAYRNGMYSRGTKKVSNGEKLFLRTRNLMREKMINDFGYIFCERCGTTTSYQFEMHHIIYRSEKPNHEHLHNKLNLINLCIECHNWYHKAKANRNELVEERKLYELFGEDVRNRNTN